MLAEPLKSDMSENLFAHGACSAVFASQDDPGRNYQLEIDAGAGCGRFNGRWDVVLERFEVFERDFHDG